MYEEQLQLEKDILIQAQHKIDSGFISIIEKGTLTETSFGQKLLRVSLPAIEEGIKDYFRVPLRGAYRKNRERLKAFYEGREDVLAYIILNCMITYVSKHPRGLMAVGRNIVQGINMMINLDQHRASDPKLYAYLDYEFKDRGKGFIAKRKKKLARLKGFDVDNLEATVKLGVSLISIVINSGTNLFKIYTVTDRPHNTKHEVSLSDEAMKLIAQQRDVLVKEVFTYKPLLLPPCKTVSFMNAGGYLTIEGIKLVKLKHDSRKSMLKLYDDFDTNGRFMNIIHKIQNTAWQVNTKVMDVMQYIIDNNLVDPSSSSMSPKLYGDIPYMDYMDVNEMCPKENYGKVNSDGMFDDVKDYKAWYKAYTDQKALVDTITGKRMAYLFALDTAKEYKDREEFYFSYQFDYRYRLYPIQQHLNPQQTGNLKALLQFSKGQVLNKEGLRWLKIHGANCYGLDKAPYEERVKAIEEREAEIKEVAKDPLNTLDLWARADSPFEYLAFCSAYSDYLNDNNAFIHIPVALDAVCSGIQIYSGLLRDGVGASAVNVVNRYEEVEVPDDYVLQEGEEFVV